MGAHFASPFVPNDAHFTRCTRMQKRETFCRGQGEDPRPYSVPRPTDLAHSPIGLEPRGQGIETRNWSMHDR